jgi:tryptophanyl-tRNA synthetase
MIQFKEKSVQQTNGVNVGLLDYPVLMAADILLYRADLVPVGEDQRQHLELTREICRRFNSQYSLSQPILKEPQALISPTGARIMSLADGTKKMSKSDQNDFSRINMLDSPDLISKKIRRCKTDTFPYVAREEQDGQRPECENLLCIYELVTGLSRLEVDNQVTGMNWGTFKPLLVDALIAELKPIQEKYEDIMKGEEQIRAVLERGREAANALGEETLQDVRDSMGFYRRN